MLLIGLGLRLKAGLRCRILNGLETGLSVWAGETSGLAKCATIDDLAQALTLVRGSVFVSMSDCGGSDSSSSGNGTDVDGSDDLDGGRVGSLKDGHIKPDHLFRPRREDRVAGDRNISSYEWNILGGVSA